MITGRIFAALACLGTAALLLAGCAAGPQPNLESAAQPRSATYSASLLWQVEGVGSRPSYVLGTLHSADLRLRDLLPEVRRALEESELAAFELLRTREGDLSLMEAVHQPPGRWLEDVIGPELFQRTVAAVSSYGLSAEKVQGMTPLALLPFLAYPRREIISAARGQPVFDEWLQLEARGRGKALHSLESYEEQISLFGDLNDAEQAALVSDLLTDYVRVETMFESMLGAYLAGDLTTIMVMATDLSEASDPDAAARFSRRLLDDRNRTMVERMVPLMQEGPVFVAVGAAHLGGEAGILSLLEGRGYRVARVRETEAAR